MHQIALKLLAWSGEVMVVDALGGSFFAIDKAIETRVQNAGQSGRPPVLGGSIAHAPERSLWRSAIMTSSAR
jgi:hypothetical protein